jgi:hypothetical protein
MQAVKSTKPIGNQVQVHSSDYLKQAHVHLVALRQVGKDAECARRADLSQMKEELSKYVQQELRACKWSRDKP